MIATTKVFLQQSLNVANRFIVVRFSSARRRLTMAVAKDAKHVFQKRARIVVVVAKHLLRRRRPLMTVQ